MLSCAPQEARGADCPSSGSIASLVRFKYIPALVESTAAVFPHSVGIADWSCVEIGLGIIAGCLATLRPLFRKVFDLGPRTQSNTYLSTTALSSEGREMELTYGQEACKQEKFVRSPSKTAGRNQRSMMSRINS
jgi:hypothetical protein